MKFAFQRSPQVLEKDILGHKADKKAYSVSKMMHFKDREKVPAYKFSRVNVLRRNTGEKALYFQQGKLNRLYFDYICPCRSYFPIIGIRVSLGTRLYLISKPLKIKLTAINYFAHFYT